MVAASMKEAVLREYPDMYRLAYSIVRNKDDAMDVVQDSVYKAMTGGNGVKEGSVHSWLMTVTSRTAIDLLRKKDREVSTDEDEMPVVSTEDRYEDTDLSRALGCLNPKERSAVSLRYFEDMKIGDVAKAMSINENSAKTLLYRAIAKMRDFLEGGGKSYAG